MTPHSSDLHRVFEHAIAATKRDYRKKFTQLVGKVGHRRAMGFMIECVEECINRVSIEKDVATLNKTMHSVKNNGGDWTDKPLR